MGESYDCVILAAGLSSRMGEWKMALPVAGSTVIERTVESARSFCSRVIVVSGHRREELESLLFGKKGVELIFNPDYRKGMFTSVQTGLHGADTAHIFITLGDMPFVEASTYRKLSRAAAGNHVILPVYRNRGGHPVLISKRVRDSVISASPGANLKTVLGEFPQVSVPIDDPRVLVDLDTPEDADRHIR